MSCCLRLSLFVILIVSSKLLFARTSYAASGVVQPEATLEKVWSDGTFTEGGALDERGGILFSDIGNRILRFDPTTGQTTTFREPSGRANGLIFTSGGRLIAAEGAKTGGNRRVSITGLDGIVRTLVDSIGGKRFNSPNDVAVDGRGRIYFTDPRYRGDEPRELDQESVYRIDPDGTVHRLETPALKPNGLVVSPDGQTLFVADIGPERNALFRLDLDTETGTVSNPRKIKDFGNGRGIDGMTITTDGLVVAAAGAGSLGGVYIYKPDGTPIDFIQIPETPTNVEFGGPQRATLYITAGVSLYRIETTLEGYQLWPQ